MWIENVYSKNVQKLKTKNTNNFKLFHSYKPNLTPNYYFQFRCIKNKLNGPVLYFFLASMKCIMILIFTLKVRATVASIYLLPSILLQFILSQCKPHITNTDRRDDNNRCKLHE